MRDGHGGMKRVRLSRQTEQLPASGFHIGRLHKAFAVKREHLIGADDECLRMPLAYRQGLGHGQRHRNIIRRCAGLKQRSLGGALIDVCRHRFEGDSRIPKERLTRTAGGGKNQLHAGLRAA
jgi:hypothetical protein